MKTTALFLLLISCATTTHRDIASEQDNSVFYDYLDTITNETSTPIDKAFYFMELLRKTDGANSGEKVITIKGPALPLGFTREQIIHRFSSQKNLLKLTKTNKIPKQLLSWASGAKSPRVFKSEKFSKFFQDLFSLIESSFDDIQLNRLNLFHAHFVFDDRVWGGDMLLIFHAFEYPQDLELKKDPDNSISTADSFFTGTPSFNMRNLIWSLKKNKIWRIDTSQSSIFNHLVRSPAFLHYPKEVIRANTIQELFFGKIVGDINYFPQEYEKPFITRGAGNPPLGNF